MATYNENAVVTMKNLADTVTRVKTEYLGAISKAGHARFTKAESVPTAETAEENVLYLVMNSETNHYDVYALVEGSVELIDDTTVNLDGYTTDAELEEAIKAVNAAIAQKGGALYTATKTDLDASDDSVITAYFAENTEASPVSGDVFVVTTTVDSTTYEQSAYSYNGTAWVAMTGNVDADKVILQEDITMAGNYTAVGNLTKTQTGTATFATKGMSVQAALMEILSKRLQPSITAQPSVSGFALTGAGAVEAGTTVSPAYTAGTLSAGSYTYGPATDVTASHWKVERVTNSGSTTIHDADEASLAAGTDDSVIIGDGSESGVVTSLKYTATATHGAGVTAADNLGSDSSPAVAIAAGTKSKTTSAYSAYRSYFSGATTTKPDIDSAYIRSLTNSKKAYAAGTITINVPVGAVRVAIACISGKTGVTKVINETAMNADVTSTFTKSTVEVEGADGYTAKTYNVWVFEPAVAYENAATLKVTLG